MKDERRKKPNMLSTIDLLFLDSLDQEEFYKELNTYSTIDYSTIQHVAEQTNYYPSTTEVENILKNL